MKGWHAILIAMATIVGLVIALALALPRQFRIERTTTIAAPVGAVWALLGDVRAHEAWVPWIADDPTLSITWGETTTGAGASYAWTSQGTASGAFIVTLANEPRRLEYTVALESMGEATGWFEASPEGDGTKLTWRFQGQNDGPLGGVVSMMMDRLVGRAFDQGLADLTALAEAAPRPEITASNEGQSGTDPGGALPPTP